MIIQQILVRTILSPLNDLMNRLPNKIRDLVFLVGGFGIIFQSMLYHMGLIEYRFLIFFAISCVFMGLLILGGMGREVKPVNFHKILSVFWFGVGILMLQSGIRNNMDYLPEALLFLVAYPILYICWGSGDRERIFKLLLRLCRLTGLVFAVGSFLLIQITASRYAGLFINSNVAAYFLAVVCVGLAVNILYSRLSWRMVPDILLFGVLFALLYYTTSRTGLLGLFCAAGVALVFYALTHTRKELLKCLTKAAACVVVSVVFAFFLVYIYQLRVYLPLPYLDLETQEMYYFGGDSMSSNAEGFLWFDTSGYDELTEAKTDMTNKTADQYSTGRLSVWKAYAKKLNLFGHTFTPPVYIELLNREIKTPHMTILQVAYESGIVAGIFYLLLNLGTGIGGIWFAWSHRNENFALLPLMFTLVFGVLSMLSSCKVSFWYLTTFFYYLVQFPILVKPSVQECTDLSEPESITT